MKGRKRIVWALFACFSLLVAASAHAGPLIANRTVDIHFTGYCDGLHLVINENTGIVLATETGCISASFAGTVGSLNGTYRGGAVTLTDAAHGTHKVILDKPMVWVYYNANGTVSNSGTYHVGTPEYGIETAGSSNQLP